MTMSPSLTNSHGAVRPHYLTEVGTTNRHGNGFTFGKFKRAVANLRMDDRIRGGDLSQFAEVGKKAKANAVDAVYAIAFECLNRYGAGVGYHPTELVGFGGCPQYGGEPDAEVRYPKYMELKRTMGECDADPKKRKAWVLKNIPDEVAGFWIAATNECIQAAAVGKMANSDYDPYKPGRTTLQAMQARGLV